MSKIKERIIKYYNFQIGNNILVGTNDFDMYDSEKIPRFYTWQADNCVGCRQLAGYVEEEQDETSESGETDPESYGETQESDYGYYESGDGYGDSWG